MRCKFRKKKPKDLVVCDLLLSYNMASEGKKRKPNLTDEEMKILTSSVVENRDVLFAKFSSSITNEKKKATWEEIASL